MVKGTRECVYHLFCIMFCAREENLVHYKRSRLCTATAATHMPRVCDARCHTCHLPLRNSVTGWKCVSVERRMVFARRFRCCSRGAHCSWLHRGNNARHCPTWNTQTPFYICISQTHTHFPYSPRTHHANGENRYGSRYIAYNVDSGYDKSSLACGQMSDSVETIYIHNPSAQAMGSCIAVPYRETPRKPCGLAACETDVRLRCVCKSRLHINAVSPRHHCMVR